MLRLNEQQVEDLLVGAKVMGTGGGGEIEWARPMIQEVFEKGKEFVLVDPEEVPDDGLIVIAGRVGGGITDEMRRMVEGYQPIKERAELVAVKKLSTYLGREPYAILPTELGAGNTIAAMYIAAMLDRPTVDADACGRAKPEISISTTNVAGVPVAPLCLVTQFGDVVFIDTVVDDVRAEHLCRALANASGGLAGLCRCPMDGRVMKRAVVPNSVTKCISIGKAIREAKMRGEDPVEALIRAVEGVEIFRGKVASFRREERGAFMWGDISISGEGEYKGSMLKVFFKNEHLISWLNGKPYVMCPDALCIVDSKTALGLSNWGNDFTEDRDVVVIGVKAHPMWRTEKGLRLFGPAHFGYDIRYVPLEDVIKRAR